MHHYYERVSVAPTFADFRDEAALARYASAREALLAPRLGLPPLLFRDADVLEYGPDTGENAVVFARWGATLTLVEPVVHAHAAIRTYFERFNVTSALREIATGDVLGYVPDRTYDVVVAEGFIHTVKPDAAWLAAFARALAPGGLLLESHYEQRAALFELSLKVPIAALLRHGEGDELAAAERCYRTKWDRIPHTRAFASWVMDVLVNPFQRPPTMCQADALLRDADAAGFDLYASWPKYVDGLENDWSKRRPSRAEALERELEHVRRSVLTFVLGTKAYIADARRADAIGALVDEAVNDINASIDSDDANRNARLAATLRELAGMARRIDVITDGDGRFDRGLAALDGWARVHEAFARSDDEEAVAILNRDDAIIDGWGNPNHLSVWRRRGQ